MSRSAAARVGDPIAHSHAGLGMMLGLAAGVVAGVVLVGATVATGGAALAVVAAVGGAAGLASFGGLKGMHIGEASMGPPCGVFITGAPNVLINGRPATFTAGAFATCSKESGGPIPLATGAATVTITAGLAGRVGETLGCSAKSVSAASPDVVIGGPSAADPAVTINPEVPGWAVTGLQALGVAGALLALPYSVVALGVAGTVGVGALGMVGSAVGGRAMHAAGEAMGMSEAGVRAMEAAGELGGGLLAGHAASRYAAPRFGTPPATQAELGKMPVGYQARYAAARATGFKKLDFGQPGARGAKIETWYPPNNGGVGTPKLTRLAPNMKLDRYGAEKGSFMSAAGDSFEQRALPGIPGGAANKYTTAIGLDGQGPAVEESPIAPWFDQPGGGTQYRLVDPATGGKFTVDDTVNNGYLTRGH